MSAGPFRTERDALDAAKAARAAMPPAIASGTAANWRRLMDAVKTAEVTLGAFDQRTVDWLAEWEGTTCEVIAGIIERAHEAGKAKSGTETEQWAVREARDTLARWDQELEGGKSAIYSRERVLADHLRTVLSLLPEESTDG